MLPVCASGCAIWPQRLARCCQAVLKWPAGAVCAGSSPGGLRRQHLVTPRYPRLAAPIGRSLGEGWAQPRCLPRVQSAGECEQADRVVCRRGEISARASNCFDNQLAPLVVVDVVAHDEPLPPRRRRANTQRERIAHAVLDAQESGAVARPNRSAVRVADRDHDEQLERERLGPSSAPLESASVMSGDVSETAGRVCCALDCADLHRGPVAVGHDVQRRLVRRALNGSQHGRRDWRGWWSRWCGRELEQRLAHAVVVPEGVTLTSGLREHMFER